MSDQVRVLKDGENLPVEPVGTLLTAGWYPGTWVVYSTTAPTFNAGAIAAVEISDGTGTLAGFLITGPQHLRPVEQLSDMWTTDTIQKAGGDTYADWSATNAGGALSFDTNGLVDRLGSRVATLYVPPTGYHKFYVFETQNKAERAVAGSGAALTYTPGDLLYVSENGLITSQKETVSHTFTGYVVARFGTHSELGDFIIMVAASV